MRLIDADYLKKVLNSGTGEAVKIEISKSMPLEKIVDIVIRAYKECLFAELEKVPTAYDVDKEVERLEEEKNTYKNPVCREDDFRKYCRGIASGLDFSIDIIKSGGIK